MTDKNESDTQTPNVTEESLSEVTAQLDAFARRHYELDTGLAGLLESVQTPLGRRQYTRLLGVLIKAPYADERARRPSESTHAVFAMDWKDPQELDAVGVDHWQLPFMRELIRDQDPARGRGLQENYDALLEFKYETSLGKYILNAFRTRVCGDVKTSAKIRAAIAEAKKSGVNLIEPTTARIQVGVASVVAVAVGAALPAFLAAVAAPVVGAMALLLCQVGVDGFCAWSQAAVSDLDQHDDRQDV